MSGIIPTAASVMAGMVPAEELIDAADKALDDWADSSPFITEV